MQRARSRSVSRSRQPSPLSCASLSASARPRALAEEYREAPISVGKQESLAQRLGDMQLSPGVSEHATARSTPWPHRARAQNSSEIELMLSSSWDWPKHAQQGASGAASSAASNAPVGESPPSNRGMPAIAVTPGSAVSVSSRFKPPELALSSISERQAGAPPPSNPAQASQQVVGSRELAQKPASQCSELQSEGLRPAVDRGGESDRAAEMPRQAQRAARLHSALIRHTAVIQLAAELESLLRLLALPSAAQDAATDGRTLLLPSVEAAAEYACCVLCTIGTLHTSRM